MQIISIFFGEDLPTSFILVLGTIVVTLFMIKYTSGFDYVKRAAYVWITITQTQVVYFIVNPFNPFPPAV